MKKLALAVVAAALLAAPFAASAQLQLGGRLALALPQGETAKGFKQSDLTRLQVPLELDLAWRFGNFSPGVYISIAPGLLNKDLAAQCDAANISCATAGVRMGVEGIYDFAPEAPASAWVGGRVGVESLGWGVDNGGNKDTLAASGLSIGVEGGFDFRLGFLSVGPYASLEFGKYSKTSSNASGSTVTESIPSGEQTWHTWIVVGAKGTITF